MKKVLSRILAAIILLMIVWPFYRAYRVMNVYDEIALSLNSVLPYTETDFNNFDVFIFYKQRTAKPLTAYEFRQKRNDLIVAFHLGGFGYSRIEIDCYIYELEDLEILLKYKYNIWTKKLTPYLNVYTEADGGILPADRGEREVEELLGEYGTTIDEVYGYLNGEIDGMIHDWIEANEGRSKFSEKDYGKINIQTLKFS